MPDGRPNPKPEKWVDLSERQCLGLITLVRNTEDAVAVKMALVDEFLRMKAVLHSHTVAHNEYLARSAGVGLESKKNGFQREYFAVTEFYKLKGYNLKSHDRVVYLFDLALERSRDMKKPTQVVFDPASGNVKGFHRSVLESIYQQEKC